VGLPPGRFVLRANRRWGSPHFRGGLLNWDENFYSAQIGGKDFLAEIQERGKLNGGKVLDYAKDCLSRTTAACTP